MTQAPRRRDARQPVDPRRTDADDVQRAAGQLLDHSAGDIETARQMGSGDVGDSQDIPAGDLDRAAVAYGRKVAQDSVPHGASDVGAPWERIPDGVRELPPYETGGAS
jgi:hypothetical protein